MAERVSTGTGPGRVLVFAYGIFVVAAGSRAGYQIATKFHEAPFAYVLSAVAALIYLFATVALAMSGPRAALLALIACSIELTGVLVVGTLSVIDRTAFPDQAVWSLYGMGYGFVPLVLPILGLLWIRHVRRVNATATPAP
jgi:hypothetical protein